MKYVFTDCFDTLIVRNEHPYGVVRRWCECVNRLYPNIDKETIYSDRMELTKCKALATEGVISVYGILASKYYEMGLITDKEEFIKEISVLELKCEESTAQENYKVTRFLKTQKDNGSIIYCITDYHLSSDSIHTILRTLGIEFLDGVFSSADYGKSKHEGTLYKTVLDILQVDPSECLMVGDNIVSDIENAKRYGFHTKYFPNSFHKDILRIKNKINMSSPSIGQVGKELWKNSDSYEEFSVIFFTFCARLYESAISRNATTVVFLAREGYFLKQCFETFQRLRIPHDKRLKTDYLKCSRRAIHSVQREKCLPEYFGCISVRNYFTSIGFSDEEAEECEMEAGITNSHAVLVDFGKSDEAKAIWNKLANKIENRIAENQQAFRQYIHTKTSGGQMLLVDVGWIGRMQQGIDVLFDDISTAGFYIGIYQNLFEQPYVERHGLIFNKAENGDESKYFHIFRSNIQFYEQLLAAPHGSACFYRLGDHGEPHVFEKWDKEEEILYKEVIEDVQVRLLNDFEKLCTYTFVGLESECNTDNTYNKMLAGIMLRSCLVQSKNRLEFMKRLMTGFSQNFQQQSIGMKFEVSSISENPVNILIHPDRFVRYVSKLGVVLDRKGMGGLGRFAMKMYYGWVKFILRV